MGEFGDQYDGDVEACLRGLQKKSQEEEPENITAAVRKRYDMKTHRLSELIRCTANGKNPKKSPRPYGLRKRVS